MQYAVTVVQFVAMASLIGPVACDFKLLLLHTNDMHSRFDEVDEDAARCQNPSSNTCYGGFARVGAAVGRFKKEASKNKVASLYLDAGDVFQETVYYMEYRGKLVADMMNILRPDVMCLGNHEFDDGITGLIPYLQRLQVPAVCCNINIDNEPDLKIENQLLPSKVFEFGKMKVGVLGYLTQDISPKHLGGVKILDEIESVRREAKRLKEGGVQIIIALGHSGYTKDLQLAEEVEEVDVVVGGHSHTYLQSGDTPSEDKVEGKYPSIVNREKSKTKALVVQAYYGTKYVGRLDLIFDDKGNLKTHEGSLVELRGTKKDKIIEKALSLYSKIIKTKYGRKIGKTEVLLEGSNRYCRSRECSIGNLIADAFVDYANKNLPKSLKKVQIALVDSKSIKGSLYPKGKGKSGDILLEDVMVILPYGSNLEVLQLQGRDIRQALESGVNKYDANNGGFLRAHLMQVSGLRVQFDMTKERGGRLLGVQVAPDYNDLKDDETYNVVMSRYLCNLKDKFPMFVDKPRAGEIPAEGIEYEVLAKYIEGHSPLKAENYQNQGRITIKE